MHLDSVTVEGGDAVENLLADHFRSVYVSERDDLLSPCRKTTILSNVDWTITENEILSKLKSLSDNHSSGPDGIPNSLLKHCCSSMVKPLQIQFRKIYSKNEIPLYWKESYVTAVFKSGHKSDAKNYRSINISNCISQVFESIICDKITPV